MMEFTFDTQLLLAGQDLDEEKIRSEIAQKYTGDCLLVVGTPTLIKIHFHTNAPGALIDYCIGLGEVFDVVVENMERQSRGEHR